MEEKTPRKSSKADHVNELLGRLENWINEGYTVDQALEKLTLKQYDFLIDQNVNLDNLILSPQQQAAVKAITKSGRPRGLQYKKVYPQDKQDLYQNLVKFIEEQGGEIEPREKINYRDLDFKMGGIQYKIVLSNPRPPKN